MHLSLQQPRGEGDPCFTDLGTGPVVCLFSAQPHAIQPWVDRGQSHPGPEPLASPTSRPRGPASPLHPVLGPASPRVTRACRAPSWISRADPELSPQTHPAQNPGHTRRQDLAASAQPVGPGQPDPQGLHSQRLQAVATRAWRDGTQPHPGGSHLGVRGDLAGAQIFHLTRRPAGTGVRWREGRGGWQSPEQRGPGRPRGPCTPRSWNTWPFLQVALVAMGPR